MRFSVIVPAYNVERYLPAALESLAVQTFTDFEVVIVDDGSSDKSGAIADEYASEHDNVIVLHGENQGLLLARRKGIAAAHGEYVLHLDGDDRLSPVALERIAWEIEATNADIVAFRYSRKEDFSTADDLVQLESGFYSGPQYDVVKRQVCLGRFNNLWGKAFRLCRIDARATYGAFRGLMHGEDLLQLLPIVDASASLSRIDDVLYFYRPNDSASTASFKSSQLKDIALVCDRLLEYGSKWGEACTVAAYQGEAMQYVYLEQLNEISRTSHAAGGGGSPRSEKQCSGGEYSSVPVVSPCVQTIGW